MANDDISRFLFQPAKHYTGARMQQGRVILDSDFNENEQLDDEDLRRDLLNVIGSPGTPQEDPGFAVTDVGASSDGRLDFVIGAGAIYLGGLRFRLEQAQHFLNQTDFLQLAKEDAQALAPTGTDEKRYAVVVEAFEQTVTSVEDTELRERALGAGGPDTSTRIRRTIRVHALDVTSAAPTNCEAAFNAFRGSLPSTGNVDAFSEFQHAAKMTVDFTGAKTTEDLCNPAEEGGYLGAENQAIRVMAVTTTSIVWGFDNASPLYRVQVGSQNQTMVVTMLDRPRDQAAEPLTGQIVEILPAAAVLPNGEIVAGLTGQLARVSRGFDPDDGTIQLAPGIDLSKFVHDDDFTGFLQYPGAGVPTPDAPFFMRVWNQGSASLSATDSPQIDLVADTFVDLGATGLEVKFDTLLTPGAFWVIAARPESRQEVIPRSLKTGEPPMGPRKFYAPIALIKWKAGQSPVVTDCRTPFSSLTALRGCCNFRVGDGETTFGDFNNIQQAIDALPVEGGQICLLPGTHTGAVNIANRTGITITGCGERSVLVGDGPSTFQGTGTEPDPVILICDSTDIRLESFAVHATGRAGIHVQSVAAFPSDISLLDLDLNADGVAGGADLTGFVMPVNAVHASGTVVTIRLVIRNCRILKSSLPSFYPAVFANSSECTIADNRIDSGVPFSSGWGGIQIGSQSIDVDIHGNAILGGFGHGITLGHISYRPAGSTSTAPGPVIPIGLSLGGGSLDPTQLGLVPQHLSLDLAGTGTPSDHEPFSTGGPENVRIEDNLIQFCALSGISVAGFFTDLSQFIFTFLLQIRDNTITNNAFANPNIVAPASLAIGYGGIALGSLLGADIVDNVIANNGASEAPPIAGIVALLATDLLIEDNRIENNGPAVGAVAGIGLRGGIVVAAAVRLASPTLFPNSDGAFIIRRSLPTVRILDNTIFHPDGKTILMNAFGPVEVESNYLENHGDRAAQIETGIALLFPTTAPTALFAGAFATSVQILDFGIPLDQFAGSIFSDQLPLPPGTPLGVLQNGNVKFHDNQVVLDWVQTVVSPFVFGTLIFSGDHVSYQNNHVTVDMHNFLVLAPGQDVTQITTGSLILRALSGAGMAGATVGIFGAGVTVSGNRIVEGITDAAFSGVFIAYTPPVAQGQTGLQLQLLYSSTVTQNVFTHCYMAATAQTSAPTGSTVPETGPVFDVNNHITFPTEDCSEFGAQPDNGRTNDGLDLAVRITTTPA